MAAALEGAAVAPDRPAVVVGLEADSRRRRGPVHRLHDRVAVSALVALEGLQDQVAGPELPHPVELRESVGGQAALADRAVPVGRAALVASVGPVAPVELGAQEA